jgi:DNA-binding CsgD family transcriptional regulator
MLAAQGMVAFLHGEGIQQASMVRAIELEEYAEDTGSYERPSCLLGLQLLWSDQLDASRPLLHQALHRATERGEEYDRAGIAFHLAHLEWEAGNREVAERVTLEALDAHRQVVDTQVESYLRWLGAFCAVREGALDEAIVKANNAIELADSIGDSFVSSFSTAIVAESELRSGHAGAAHERLVPLRDAFRESVVGALTNPFWSCDVEALVALGRLDDADEVVGDLLDRAQRADNANAIAIAQRCRGILLAARGDIAGAIDAMDAALAQHTLRPLPIELGRTLLEMGTLERRAKRKSAAKLSLERALVILEPLQARIWVARARDELGRVGLRRAAASDGLTPAQHRVAELVLAGMTNRQIADTLYMSLRTVETHLTKIYRELGVKSRAQLISTMSTTGLQHPAGDG